MVFALSQMDFRAFAEQSGSSPESGSDSRIKTAYDFLVGKGDNYGVTDAGDWSNSWGTYWNRIMEAAAWEPDGSATAAEVPSGLTFYAGSDNRTRKTGTFFQGWEAQDYDDVNCTNNNGENNSACAAGDSEVTSEEGTWTLKASGGTAASVTDNSVTISLTSNKVYMDNRTKLYWSDITSAQVDNEWAYVDGDDRTNPTGNSCNFNATGTANQYCDNQDPANGMTGEDNDVSAADFCLNLALDADNADGDSNGLTGTETNWRLPSQKEAMQAYINGATNNLPILAGAVWTSTEDSANRSAARWWNIGNSVFSSSLKNATTLFAICVRRD